MESLKLLLKQYRKRRKLAYVRKPHLKLDNQTFKVIDGSCWVWTELL